jgi:2-polyprenyl-6-methoxyphenol hydroxylase-like FAD-dependent oxidoreductase
LIIELESGRKIETKLLVGSDGNNSIVKKLAKINTRGWSHSQQAIVKMIKFIQANIMLRFVLLEQTNITDSCGRDSCKQVHWLY